MKKEKKKEWYPKRKGAAKKKKENIRQAWQENPKERDPTGGAKKKKKKRKNRSARRHSCFGHKKMSATGAEARAAVYKVNVNNRGGSLGSRLERKYQQLGVKKRAAG